MTVVNIAGAIRCNLDTFVWASIVFVSAEEDIAVCVFTPGSEFNSPFKRDEIGFAMQSSVLQTILATTT